MSSRDILSEGYDHYSPGSHIDYSLAMDMSGSKVVDTAVTIAHILQICSNHRFFFPDHCFFCRRTSLVDDDAQPQQQCIIQFVFIRGYGG